MVQLQCSEMRTIFCRPQTYDVNLDPTPSMISILTVLTQQQALQAIYAVNGGLTWVAANKWNTDAPICTWQGISCGRDGFIVGMDLTGFGLTGQLPDVFDSFPYLKSLYLNNQRMTSTIPATFCQLSNLQYLQANDAGMTGAIPDCICSLSFIQFVYMNNNSLTGAIPTCVDQLSFLKELHLTCNDINGTIPTGFNSLAFLIELHLDCNANLDCTSELASKPNFIFVCGLENCEGCAIPDTNCPPEVVVPDCGVYVRKVTK